MNTPIFLRPSEEPQDPVTRRTLRQFAKRLTGSDEAMRHHALKIVLETMNSSVRSSIVAELLEVLYRGHAPSCARAVEALVAIGPLAVPAIMLALEQDDTPAFLVRLTEALVGIAPALSDRARAKLYLELHIVMLRTSHDAVAKVIMPVVASLAVAAPLDQPEIQAANNGL